MVANAHTLPPLLSLVSTAASTPLVIPPAPRKRVDPALANRLHRQLTNALPPGGVLYFRRRNHRYWLAYIYPEHGYPYYALYHAKRRQRAELVGRTCITHESYTHVTRRAIAEYLAAEGWHGATVFDWHPFAARETPISRAPELVDIRSCALYWQQRLGRVGFAELWLLARLTLWAMDMPCVVKRVGE